MTTNVNATGPSLVMQRNAAELPPAMRDAQAAVQTSEVQDIIRRLGDFGLGVCMPHMHEDGGFVAIPVGMTQVEVKSNFVSLTDEELNDTVAVSWRWDDGKVAVAGSCHLRETKCD